MSQPASKPARHRAHEPWNGFTLIEILLVVAILAVVAVFAAVSLRNYGKNLELEETANAIRTDLKTARAKAMAGESGMKWGVHFVNSSSGYYELFSTPDTYANASTTTSTVTYVLGTIQFTDPAAASTKDIIFDKITGMPASSSVTVAFEGTSKTISVSSIGNIH